MPISSHPPFEFPKPPEESPFGGKRPGTKTPCTRCGTPVYDDVEICPSCGKWRHGGSLIVAGLIAVLVTMLAAWFVFANTF